MSSIGIIGAGAWGTALAQTFAKDGHDCLIWAREDEVVESINNTHENTLFLPDIKLDSRLKATNDILEAAKCPILLLVSPAQHLRTTLKSIKSAINDEKIIVICAKGIEISSGKLMSEVAREIIPEAKIAILSGPTFAAEIAQGLPAATTIGCEDESALKTLLETLSSKTFRPYGSTDLIGVQIGGAIKNVIAIGCGMVHGKGLGESARCAFMTRGIAEMARLGVAMGGKNETLLGMCGVGDLVLTASSMQSRNFSLGAALGEGKTMQDILKNRSAVTEGVHTAKIITEVAKAHNIELPVCETINAVLHDNLSIDGAVTHLLDRPLKEEL